MSARESGELALLLGTNDPGLLMLVRTVLDAANIPFVVQGDATTQLFPMGSAGPRLWQTRVLVDPTRLEEARTLITQEAEIPAESWPPEE